MSDRRIDEYLPTQGLLYFDEQLKYVISKPKIMPLKSLTLEKVRSLFRFRIESIVFYSSWKLCRMKHKTNSNNKKNSAWIFSPRIDVHDISRSSCEFVLVVLFFFVVHLKTNKVFSC